MNDRNNLNIKISFAQLEKNSYECNKLANKYIVLIVLHHMNN